MRLFLWFILHVMIAGVNIKSLTYNLEQGHNLFAAISLVAILAVGYSFYTIAKRSRNV